ncbi:hypothetical protein J2Z22_004496 [Paenibacillus forsythiae]|uniref:Uncharacterized protein n=1 Tax=Paenibacillus forsythiae TaxID=365616 RepID=A0ABU3HDM0_9BACL|nr:hypothetical protein [Paenibacillus forsythiae]
MGISVLLAKVSIDHFAKIWANVNSLHLSKVGRLFGVY